MQTTFFSVLIRNLTVAALFCFTAAVFAAECPPLPKRDVMTQKYWDLWNDEVQSKLDARIEKYRKADATVELTDVKAGSEIKVEQITHQFLFGANMFNFGQLGSKEWDDKYKAVYHTLFNTAAIPFYWKKFEREPGNLHFKTTEDDNPEFWAKVYSEKRDPTQEWYWRRPATDQMVEYCEKNGVFRHGHPMIWGNDRWHHPDWLPKKVENLPAMEKAFEKRIRELAAHYKGRINRWDIVNESGGDRLNDSLRPDFDADNPKGKYGIMPKDYTYKAFKVTNEVLPAGVVQCINDYNMSDVYVKQVSDLRSRGIRIDMVGLQMHLFNPKQCIDISQGAEIQTPSYLYGLMNRFDAMETPLHLSEITITAPGDDAVGREIQANIARNLYRAWFSWKNMEAITWWNVVDGCGAPGEPLTSGLFTRTMEPKPSYFALERLINHEWKTKFTKKAEGSKVSIPFRGFKGKYKITYTNTAGQVLSKEIEVK